MEAVSGVSQIERNAPYIRWLTRMFGRSECAEPIVSGIEGAEEADREAWREWLPPNALWVPVRTPAGERLGTLLFARDEPWGDTDIALLFRAADMCGSCVERPSKERAGAPMGIDGADSAAGGRSSRSGP